MNATGFKTKLVGAGKPSNALLIAFVLLLYFPLLALPDISSFVQDTAVQIRIGLDMIESRGLILDDIYSWHEGLQWIPHEVGWYFIIGLFYKILGLAGVLILCGILVYSTAAVAVKQSAGKVNPLIIILCGVLALIYSFPNYNARPSLFSELETVILISLLLSDKSTKFKSIAFVCMAFLTAWVHGGAVPLFFLYYFVFAVLELVYKNFKTFLINLGTMAVAFVLTLANPVGMNIWTYGLVQSTSAKDLWSSLTEWGPMPLKIIHVFGFLLILVGFMVDERVVKFEKKTITKLCLLCMLFIMATQYFRFANMLGICILMFAPEEIQLLLSWLAEKLFNKKNIKLIKNENIYYILAVVFLIGTVGVGVAFGTTYFPTNSMDDVSNMAAYDLEVPNFIKDKGYSKIYNSFSTGTWLAFYDVPVHIDNRCDLYLAEYSGEEYLRGTMWLTSIDGVNAFRNKYQPDAFVLEFSPSNTDYLKMINEITNEYSEYYTIVYDNTVTSTYNGAQMRWVIVECN